MATRPPFFREADEFRDTPDAADIDLVHDPDLRRSIRAGLVMEIGTADMPADPDDIPRGLARDWAENGRKQWETRGLRAEVLVPTGDRFTRW